MPDGGGNISPGIANILVIEDDPLVRDTLAYLLSAMGHRVAVATTGEEWVSAFRDNEYDLAFTDLKMPDLTGWEVGIAIKEHLRGMFPLSW